MILENENNEHLLNLKHILHVIQERVYLYKKRNLETKRAMKAYHRGNTVPDPFRVQIMVEAEIAYTVYHIAQESLSSIIEDIDKNNSRKLKLNRDTDLLPILQREFQIQMEKMNTVFSNLKRNAYTLLSKIPYTLHDDYQRETIAKFMYAHATELIERIFKGIAIFDEDYCSRIILELKSFLSEKYLIL